MELKAAFLFLFMLVPPAVWAQGPPYQTDDPVPVDYGHYEAYIFGSVDGTPVEMDWTGPAFEFNWGAIPTIQLHAIIPLGTIVPSNNPGFLPGGAGPSAFGITDVETGVKWAWIKETKHFPQIGSFTMFELPTGSYSKGLGVGKVWYKLPLWAQKNIGPWTLDGGAGETIVPQTQYRNFPYGGFLVKRDIIHNMLELGAEVFSHGAEGYATPQVRRLNHDGHRRLLPFQKSGSSISVLLRALYRRPDGELCVHWSLLDVGEGPLQIEAQSSADHTEAF